MAKIGSKAVELNPIQSSISLFEGKYAAEILRELLSGTKRFSELLHSIPGISSKTLNQKLKVYLQQGIITRHSYPEIPPKVEYRLTDRGRQLESIIIELHKFGVGAHLEEVSDKNAKRRMTDFAVNKGYKKFGRRALDKHAQERETTRLGRRETDMTL
ncbi:winged helix-turn-helix transcriptional regulator [Catenovulum agarivorans]|uniref:winged helix-turn-helix transcriptional regulator n=1 Tax=Catenovulum agarivorans TaxID=1172192 RepID=UPI0002FF3FAE|nr:helix-turn-helix domain-containing protein [Catenovulum agarivorans]